MIVVITNTYKGIFIPINAIIIKVNKAIGDNIIANDISIVKTTPIIHKINIDKLIVDSKVFLILFFI